MIHHSKPNSMNENGFKKILTSSQNDNLNKVKTKTSSYLNFLSNCNICIKNALSL